MPGRWDEGSLMLTLEGSYEDRLRQNPRYGQARLGGPRVPAAARKVPDKDGHECGLAKRGSMVEGQDTASHRSGQAIAQHLDPVSLASLLVVVLELALAL